MRTFIIAEAGVNHNGSVKRALDLVAVAHNAGADAVKFQTFKAERLMTRKAPKAAYQHKTTDRRQSQFEMIRALELDVNAHRRIARLCKELGIEFLSTPFDCESVTFLKKMRLRRLKIPSGEITNAPLLLKAASTGLPVILSTGIALLGEIEDALGVLAFGYMRAGTPNTSAFRNAYLSESGRSVLREKVTLLHCTSEYPAPLGEVNLRVLGTLRQSFDLPVGISDHTMGISVPIAAVALGAVVIEKHFTLDRNLPGPDHSASIEPQELSAMIQGIRDVELALGHSVKIPSATEVANRDVIRKTIVARKAIRVGDRFTHSNLGVKRPGTGISPMRYWEVLGRVADTSLEVDDVIGECNGQ